MAELRIRDIPGGSAGRRRVEVLWQEGAARRMAAVEVAGLPGGGEGERVRWYLEDYAEFPADPAPVIAREAEEQLAQAGAGLFRAVFADVDAVGIWERARDQLSEVRVEVDADPGEGPGIPWELLRDPGSDGPVALGAGAFVRTHLRAAGHPALPEPAGDRLRVLLVIARPGGRADVPFRSVASRLVRGGAEQMAGLDLDVLRPATFKRLSEVLHAAHAAGRPYHVVHFDGHGTWLDLAGPELGVAGDGGGGAGGGVGLSPLLYGVSVAGPVRPGQHGYLLFEDPKSTQNQCLVDGPALGRLLAGTGVPVLVLNACRSAYTEARGLPAGPSEGAPAEGAPAAGEDDGGLTGDVHARIRAYGSLAAEVADAGVPGVVAMRYNVYVVTAAQFMADLYAHLLTGKPLGQAAAAARRALAADPTRQVGPVPVELQDWTVPVIYESAPLVLLRPQKRDAPVIRLAQAETGTDVGGKAEAVGLPRPPDAGFFGRDETLLALDRAFDTQHVVLLHAYAGAGKSSTAAEFARWYQVTGGLDHPDHPEWGPGAVLWSSFEHRLTLDEAIGAIGSAFAGHFEANGIAWPTVTDPAQRRDLVMQVLSQVPVLWVWDNVEPVAGFPDGTPSAWTPAEQRELSGFLRELAQQTRCKVLLTSRRDEYGWLGGLPARVPLPAMPMRESLQLAAAIAARRGQSLSGPGWRALLRYAAGNPLAITVLVGQALREDLSTSEQIQGFVRRLQAGEAGLEAEEDAALGRTQSLAASLSYGFARAFTGPERARLAVLHLFYETVDVDVLRGMGDPDHAGKDAVPELAGLDRNGWIRLLDRAADIGLLTSLGGGYYQIHPALPWFFTTMFTATYTTAAAPPAQPPPLSVGQGPGQASDAAVLTRSYVSTLASFARFVANTWERERRDWTAVLELEEANLLHARRLAIELKCWREAVDATRALFVLYQHARTVELKALVDELVPAVTDPKTGRARPDAESAWEFLTTLLLGLALGRRDWAEAERLSGLQLRYARKQAADALGKDSESLTAVEKNDIRHLRLALDARADILRRGWQDRECIGLYEEAFRLAERTGDRAGKVQVALRLGNAYLLFGQSEELDRAEYWYNQVLSYAGDRDWISQSSAWGMLGATALHRLDLAVRNNEGLAVLDEHWKTAVACLQKDLQLTPPDAIEHLAVTNVNLGDVYSRVPAEIATAQRYYQQAVKLFEQAHRPYEAANTRVKMAEALRLAGRPGEALQWAHAALRVFESAGPAGKQAVEQVAAFVGALQEEIRRAASG